MKRILPALLASLLSVSAHADVIAVEKTAFQGATVINFDALANGTNVTTQYAADGVANFNANVSGSMGFARTSSTTVTPYSGAMVGMMGASIQLGQAVDRVGAWMYKYNGSQHYLTALDAGQNVLMTVAMDVGSMDSDRYDFVGIKSDVANIAYVVVSNKDLSANPQWDIWGATTFFDDFTFGGADEAAAVPEPASMSLLGMGLLALAGLRSRKRG